MLVQSHWEPGETRFLGLQRRGAVLVGLLLGLMIAGLLGAALAWREELGMLVSGAVLALLFGFTTAGVFAFWRPLGVGDSRRMAKRVEPWLEAHKDSGSDANRPPRA